MIAVTSAPLLAIHLLAAVKFFIMLIPCGFDEAMADRKKRIERTALQTAKKLNKRMILFLNDVQKNPTISAAKKKEIRVKLLECL